MTGQGTKANSMTIYKGIAHQDTAGREPRRQRAHSIIIYIFIPMVSAGAAGNPPGTGMQRGRGGMESMSARRQTSPVPFRAQNSKNSFFQDKTANIRQLKGLSSGRALVLSHENGRGKG